MSSVKETYVVHVTKLCNCKCKYCYEKDKRSTYTTEEVINVVKDIIKYRTSDSFHIEFLGGEPMMAWDNIKAVLDYFDTCDEILDVDFTITTNGTIINDELFYFIKKYNINFAISLDGHPFANQFRIFKSNGFNTYDKCIENIKILLSKGIVPSVHITTHQFNVAFLFDSILHLYDIGIKHFGIGTAEGGIKAIYNRDYYALFVSNMENLSRYICYTNNTDLKIDLFEWVKPFEDVRTYIKDDTGKVVAESYGRSGDDITSKDNEYVVQKCISNNQNIEDLEDNEGFKIYSLRKKVYELNKRRRKVLGLDQ